MSEDIKIEEQKDPDTMGLNPEGDSNSLLNYLYLIEVIFFF